MRAWAMKGAIFCRAVASSWNVVVVIDESGGCSGKRGGFDTLVALFCRISRPPQRENWIQALFPPRPGQLSTSRCHGLFNNVC